MEEDEDLASAANEAASPLSRLATLDGIDITDGRIYPDENCSRY